MMETSKLIYPSEKRSGYEYDKIPVVDSRSMEKCLTSCTKCNSILEFAPVADSCNVRCYNCSTINYVNMNRAQPRDAPSKSSTGKFTEPNRSSYDAKTPLSSGSVKETFYYDVLGVSTSATPNEIKKGYHKMAMQFHPDKHPGDAEAEEKFKEISEAYQVLSNPQLRERYDKYGKESAQPEGGFMNARQFFNEIFGGGKFDDYFGEIIFATSLEEEMSSQERSRIQRERIELLSRKLNDRLEPYVAGRRAEFEEFCYRTVEELRREPNHGLDLVHAIGYIYNQQGRKARGGLKGFAVGIHGTAHVVGSAWSAAKATADMQATHKMMQRSAEADRTSFEAKLESQGMNAIWKLGKLDVESTLTAVCDLSLRCEKNLRRSRGEALQMMGQIFMKAC